MANKIAIAWALILTATVAAAQPAADLPDSGPAPAARPSQAPADVPVVAPVPQSSPERQKEDGVTARPATRAGTGLSPAEQACRKELDALGVRFSPKPTVSEPGGCAIANPIEIESLSASIALDAPAMLNCATARTAARFMAATIDPAARRHFGSSVKLASNASAYVCRPRAGTTTLSEHAIGNAIDISAFVLEDGRRIAVLGAYEDEKAAGPFLDEVRKAACGPFKTVLGPGADADHADHLHLDLAWRRNGGTFCQ